MNWFKDLDATPRLMLSFGVLVVLMLGISYLAIAALDQSNDRLAVAYHQDLKGATVADNVVLSRIWMGRQDREAMLNLDNAKIVAANKKKMLQLLDDLHTDLEGADKLFPTPQQRALLDVIRQTLPAYEQSMHVLMDRIDAHDLAGATSELNQVNVIGKPLSDAGDRLQALTSTLGNASFDAGSRAFQKTRFALVSTAAIALVIAGALSIFIARGFSLPLGRVVQALELVAAGDLTANMEAQTRDEVGRMMGALNTALERLRSTLQDVAANAASASASSQELAAAADAVASGAQQQAASLEETSASLEQITAAVRQSADNARQASQLASGSRDSAEAGQEVVAHAVTAMAEINVASAKISDIISTIDEIAFQTNLLAVNAAVEAARAGDEGRGFAVVAAEVRSLAQRSAGAAKEIKALIQDSLRKVEKGSELVNKSGETLRTIVGSVKGVTEIVNESAAAAAEQSTGIEQVNTAISQMDQVTQSNAARTEQLSSTAQALSEQSLRLMELVGTFVLGKDGRQTRGMAPAHRSAIPVRKPITPKSGVGPRTVGPPRSKSSGLRTQPFATNRTALAVAPASRDDGSSFEEF